LESII